MMAVSCCKQSKNHAFGGAAESSPVSRSWPQSHALRTPVSTNYAKAFTPRAAGPPAKSVLPHRAKTRSRWSLDIVKKFTIFKVSSTGMARFAAETAVDLVAAATAASREDQAVVPLVKENETRTSSRLREQAPARHRFSAVWGNWVILAIPPRGLDRIVAKTLASAPLARRAEQRDWGSEFQHLLWLAQFGLVCDDPIKVPLRIARAQPRPTSLPSLPHLPVQLSLSPLPFYIVFTYLLPARDIGIMRGF